MTAHEVTMAARIPVVRAAVTVGPVETSYWRAGSGEPVILLGAHPSRDEGFDAQVVRLASQFRVIVPEHVTTEALAVVRDGTRSSFAAWLSDFAEGLGVSGTHVVATQEYADALRHLAGDSGCLFGRLICLVRGTADISPHILGASEAAGQLSLVTVGAAWAEDVVRRLRGPVTLID